MILISAARCGLTLLLLLRLRVVWASTYKPDKDALLAFKNSIQDYGYILSGWSEYTDPCIDQWPGVSCTCYPFFEPGGSGQERAKTCYPLEPYLAEQGSRILQLNLGDIRVRDWNVLSGALPASLGNLTELRVLNLADNRFWGPIPDEWSALKELEIISMTNNNISGPLPSYFSTFYNLKYVFLENNSFTGPIPSEWCDGSWWMFDVRHNPGLCDEIDWCLEDRILTFDGTSLIDVIADRDMGMGGYCDVSPPSCEIGGSACSIKVPDPPYWTFADRVSFVIPDHISSDGGVGTKYKWKICTDAGQCITDWTDYQGKDLVQSASITDPNSTEAGVIAQLVHVVDSELPGNVTLKNGMKYQAKVLAYNAAGVLNGIEMTSDIIMADLTPPVLPEGKSIYNGEYLNNVAAQVSSTGIGLSWDAFEDEESGISQYYYQIFEYKDGITGSYIGNPVTRKKRVSDPGDRNAYASDLGLIPGKKYFARVSAVNGAGVENWADSSPVTIIVPGEGIVVETTTKGVKVSSLVVVLAVVGSFLVAIFFVILLLLRKRYNDKRKANRKRKGQLRNLRQLLNNMSDHVGNSNDPKKKQDNQGKYVAFVITDLENSTGIASSAPSAYEYVQEAHDTLLRDLIAAYGAYEINTEGDAFHVAFQDVATAVQFCMEIQYEMMEIEWPKEVLRLSGCETVYSKSQNHYIYRGPRIRMGIHCAEEGQVVQQLHSITKHRIFSGVSFQITRELCESATGGQVLMTHSVWERLKSDMHAAGFPVVEQLGAYTFQSCQKPIWVYQIRSLLGKPLHRPTLPIAGKLTGIKSLNEGAGLSIVAPPMPRSTAESLTFICIKLDKDQISASLDKEELPQKLLERLHETISVCAMQYEGYAYRTSTNGYFRLVFRNAVDAIRMSHLIQFIVMSIHWPSDLHEWCGKEELSADGKDLFRGPRLSIGIHESSDYNIRPIPQTRVTPEGFQHVDYVGLAEEVSRTLSDCAHGGQVILSESAWSVVQHQLPGGPQVISLGTHIIQEPCFPGPVMLMEVMPKLLSKRTFPRPKNTTFVEPGYRDAPSGNSIVTIVHLKVVKPEIVSQAEKMTHTDSRYGGNADIVASFAQGVALASKAIRMVLKDFDGYECKEPHPGKFTMAFSSLDSAVKWSAAVQTALIELDWPTEILEWPGCRATYAMEDHFSQDDNESYVSEGEDFVTQSGSSPWKEESIKTSEKTDEMGNSLIWRGLSVRIGMASGGPLSKAPLNTGRADYFGTIPNLAARLVNIAQPGQVLFDASKLDTLIDMKWNGEKAFLSGDTYFKDKQYAHGVYLTPIGQLKIKGIDELRSVFQADASSLQSREFEEVPCVVRSMVSNSVSRRIASLRKASEASTGFHPTVSEKSFAAPKPGIFASISRSKDSGSNNSLMKRVSLSLSARNLSRESDASEFVPQSMGEIHINNVSYSDTSSVGGVLLRQAMMSSMVSRKNSDSSLATTPKSYMSQEPSQTFRSSPVKSKQALLPKGSSELPSTIPEGQTIMRCEGAYGSLNDISQWDGRNVLDGTPTAASKVVDHWDTSLAVEEAMKESLSEMDEGRFDNKQGTDDVFASEDGSSHSFASESHRSKFSSRSRMWQEHVSTINDERQPESKQNTKSRLSHQIKDKFVKKFRNSSDDDKKNDSMRIF